MTPWFQSRRTLHVFLSYTSREEEVQLVQPLVDAYCHALWRQARAQGLDVFYDHFSMERRWYSDEDLMQILDHHIDKADLFVGLISPAYVQSRWCVHEWRAGPMKPQKPFGQTRPLTQAIYWKPDYHEAPPDSYDVVRDLDNRQQTDVTFAYGHPEKIRDAAERAARVGLQLLLTAANR